MPSIVDIRIFKEKMNDNVVTLENYYRKFNKLVNLAQPTLDKIDEVFQRSSDCYQQIQEAERSIKQNRSKITEIQNTSKSIKFFEGIGRILSGTLFGMTPLVIAAIGISIITFPILLFMACHGYNPSTLFLWMPWNPVKDFINEGGKCIQSAFENEETYKQINDELLQKIVDKQTELSNNTQLIDDLEELAGDFTRDKVKADEIKKVIKCCLSSVKKAQHRITSLQKDNCIPLKSKLLIPKRQTLNQFDLRNQELLQTYQNIQLIMDFKIAESANLSTLDQKKNC
ncbi:MAG: hypothetical protein H0T62_11345 [Parachlamydiaceae bacterium]|nr:hypothetical protein [Parachlamydiaceae bacterium]